MAHVSVQSVEERWVSQIHWQLYSLSSYILIGQVNFRFSIYYIKMYTLIIKDHLFVHLTLIFRIRGAGIGLSALHGCSTVQQDHGWSSLSNIFYLALSPYPLHLHVFNDWASITLCRREFLRSINLLGKIISSFQPTHYIKTVKPSSRFHIKGKYYLCLHCWALKEYHTDGTSHTRLQRIET